MKIYERFKAERTIPFHTGVAVEACLASWGGERPGAGAHNVIRRSFRKPWEDALPFAVLAYSWAQTCFYLQLRLCTCNPVAKYSVLPSHLCTENLLNIWVKKNKALLYTSMWMEKLTSDGKMGWREHAKGWGSMCQREVSTLILVCEVSHKVHTVAALPTEWQPSEWHVHRCSLNIYRGQSPRRENACSVKIC